jgi:hypothetical protein
LDKPSRQELKHRHNYNLMHTDLNSKELLMEKENVE